MQHALTERIEMLKRERSALILAHNYQRSEIQDIADFSGDSLELSRKAARNEADVIVFCGVHFMAETAAVLSPSKTVLMPDLRAGCPMADMITAAQLRELKAAHPEAKVICYVNSTAEVKAESDCCCTSANAVDIVNAYSDAKEIIFVPDRNLGEHAAELSGRPLILWEGHCPVHVQISLEDIRTARSKHPDALVMVHPECTRDVRTDAEEVLSTGQMCRFARQSTCKEFIVGTETGILHRLNLENPGKRFYAARDTAICHDMKLTDMEKLAASLENMEFEVRIPANVVTGAKRAIENMLRITEQAQAR